VIGEVKRMKSRTSTRKCLQEALPVMDRGRTRKLLALLTLEFHQEGKQWVGVCRELGTSTFHKDLSQAKAELIELVELHLDALEETGERQRFFKENSIKTYTLSRVPKRARVEIPICHLGVGQVLTESVAMPVGCC
jgi:predicted RNase H-like HicB family nuclease